MQFGFLQWRALSGSQLSGAAAAEARQRAVAAIKPWLDRFDAVVVGPGLGRDPLILDTVAEVGEGAWHRGSACGRGAHTVPVWPGSGQWAGAMRSANASALSWPLASCPQVMHAVRRRSLPMVVDADGLWLVNQQPGLVQGTQGVLACTMPAPAAAQRSTGEACVHGRGAAGTASCSGGPASCSGGRRPPCPLRRHPALLALPRLPQRGADPQQS